MERDVVVAYKKDSVYIKLDCERSVAAEISDHFTFEVPNAKFHPSYKSKFWDGKIRLFNVNNQLLYYGLVGHLAKFCEARDYDFIVGGGIHPATNFSAVEAEEFVQTLNLPFKPRDYQMEAFTYAVRNRRGVLLSPTASGKSLIIYLLARFYKVRSLIIVPTISLVTQMAGDFRDYGYQDDCHLITAGESKDTDQLITISTWQSIYKMKKEWFDQFDLVIGDEAHQFKAKSLTAIMTKLTSCNFRFGLTGTLDGAQTNKLVLEGLFGPVKHVIKTKQLIDQKHLADFKIKIIVLKYDEAISKITKDYKYQDEVDFLVRNEQRNKFIRNLSLSLKGNSLILYQYVEKHGQILYDLIKEKAGDRKVFFVHGGVDGDTREEVRAITEKEQDAIIVASFGTFSTGVNIRNLHNIVFASPSKSRVRNLQSIGRGLRKGDNKTSATLIDIADDLTYKTKTNYTLKHFAERVKLYNEEKFDYKIYKVKIDEPRTQTNTLF